MAETATPIQAGGRTGDTCRQVGPYRSESRVPLVVFFRRGDRFPNDPEGRATNWSLLSELRDGADVQ